jgi:hypothetical protein
LGCGQVDRVVSIILISFGVKDTRDFPQADEIVTFFLEFGKREAEKLVQDAYAQKKKA